MAEQPSETPLQAQSAPIAPDEITQPAAAFSAATVVEGNIATPPAPSIETPAGNEAAIIRDIPMVDSMDDVPGVSTDCFIRSFLFLASELSTSRHHHYQTLPTS